jgi:hypothetical protein
VIWLNNANLDINYFSLHGSVALIEGCIGLLLMASVIGYGIRKLPVPSLNELKTEALKLNAGKILTLYLISTLFLNGLGYALGGVAGLDQVLGTLGSLKWLFFIVYGYVSWARKKWLLLSLIIIFEFSTGLFSYFSTFKEVLLFTIILALTFVRRVSVKQFIVGMLIVTGLTAFFLTWTAIKGEYRAYLNKGTRQQVISVSRSEAFGKIQEELGNLNWDEYQQALNMLLYRVQYVQHLQLTMDRVPGVLPYEYGNLWKDNITFVLTPRILWPDKPVYEATVKTNKYTGKSYAGLKMGSSFSLGYFADSYIDFGFVGMFIPLALIAFYVLTIYRTFYNFKGLNLLFRYGVVNLVIYEFSDFESDGLFLFGRLTLMFLVFWLLCKFAFPPLQRWVYK